MSAPLCQGADGGPGACGSAAELPLWRLLEANIARVSRQEKGAVLMAKDREGVFGGPVRYNEGQTHTVGYIDNESG